MSREEKAGKVLCWWLVLALALFWGALPQTALAKKTLPAKPIDINAATVKELEDLHGVGPTTAKAIVLFRTRSGRFRRVEDLLAIRGISEPKLKKMRPYVTLGPPPQPVKVTGGASKSSSNVSSPPQKPSPNSAPSPAPNPAPNPAH